MHSEGGISAFMSAIGSAQPMEAIPGVLYAIAERVLGRGSTQRNGLEPADLVNEFVARELEDRRRGRRTADWSTLSASDSAAVARRRMKQLASEAADDRRLYRQVRAHVSAAIARGLPGGEIAEPLSLMHQGRLSAELVARAVASRADGPLTQRDATRMATELYRVFLKRDHGAQMLEHLDVSEVIPLDDHLEATALAEAFIEDVPTEQRVAFGLRLADQGFVEIGRTVKAAPSTIHARVGRAEERFIARARAREASPRAVRLAIRHVAHAACGA